MGAKVLRAVATPVLWLGVAALTWGVGFWLLWVAMGGAADESVLGFSLRIVLLGALVGGVVLARSSRRGFLLLAAAACASAVALSPLSAVGLSESWPWFAIGLLTAGAALVRWALPGELQPASAAADLELARPSAVQTGLVWSLTIGGLITAARAGAELVRGLVELPGASPHLTGDVTMWLLLALPIPVAWAVTMLGAAWSVRHRQLSAGSAAVRWLVGLGLALTMYLLDARYNAANNLIFRPLEDPLLWGPIGLAVGSLCGLLVVVLLTVRGPDVRDGHSGDATHAVHPRAPIETPSSSR